MAVTTAVIASVSAVSSGVAGALSASAANKAQRKAGKLERAQAQINQNREIRRAIAAKRLQQAELLQGAEALGTRTNSAVSGAVGSLSTQTAANIGFSNTQFGTQRAQSTILQSGATRAARFGGVSSLFGGISSASSTLSRSPKTLDAIKKLF